MSGYLHVFMTGERVTAESAEHGDTEGHGYIDPRWSRTVFQDRNNAGTVLSVPLDSPDLDELIADVLDEHLGAFNDNCDGTFYGASADVDFQTGDTYTYALHFVEKYIDSAGNHQERPYLHTAGVVQS